jgi:hypothetical protein
MQHVAKRTIHLVHTPPGIGEVPKSWFLPQERPRLAGEFAIPGLERWCPAISDEQRLRLPAGSEQQAQSK